MTEKTYDEFDGEKLTSLTTIETFCPCCHKPIRFIANDMGVMCYKHEAEHYKRLFYRQLKENYCLKNVLEKYSLG